MKAQELKTGMTVKYGNVWVLIEGLEQKEQKNGKQFIAVTGTALSGVVKRRGYGYKNRITKTEEIKNYQCSFKNLTKVNVK